MTENKVPLFYSEDFSQPYFTAKIGKSQDSPSANFYLNPDQSVPLGYILYNYYGDGELYLSPSYLFDGLQISVKNENMSDVYEKVSSTPYQSLESHGVSSFEISKKMLDIPGINLNYSRHPIQETDNLIYVIIKFDYIFDINIDENTVSQPTLPQQFASSAPICAHFTHDGDALQIISENYKFANTIKNAYLCSHPNRTSNYSPCQFSNCFADCPIYSPSKQQLTKVAINHKNTENSTIISVNKLLLSNNFTSYDLYNESNNQSIAQISIPQDISQQDIDKEISDLLSEITSLYEGDEITELDCSENKKETESFIATIFN